MKPSVRRQPIGLDGALGGIIQLPYLFFGFRLEAEIMSLLSELEAHAPEYIEWRHTFHEHPELGLETPWTADLVAAKLRSFGIEVTQGVGGHAVSIITRIKFCMRMD